MPKQLVHTIGSLMDQDCSPSDRRKWDGVRRIVTEKKTSDPLRQAVIRSLHGKKVSISFRDIKSEYDAEEIEPSIKRGLKNSSIEKIIDEGRR